MTKNAVSKTNHLDRCYIFSFFIYIYTEEHTANKTRIKLEKDHLVFHEVFHLLSIEKSVLHRQLQHCQKK